VIVNDLDLGGRPAQIHPRAGQAIGTARVVGDRTVAWADGGQLHGLDVAFSITAWQALGGQSAYSLGANRLLRGQLKELVLNPFLQPCYVQWAQTSEGNPSYASRTDADDGWYLVSNLDWDAESYNGAGSIDAAMTVVQVAPSLPSSLAVWFSGGVLATTFTGTTSPVLGLPVGATLVPNQFAGRNGGEGLVGVATAVSTLNPCPFVRPPTIAGLFTGQCRVYDTINTSSNPVPVAGGTFVNANWVQIYGTQHDFVGDCVVTNGLLLLLYQVGQSGAPVVYFWNTSLTTPTWQQAGTVQYIDNGFAGSLLREINLDRIGLEEVRIQLRMSTGSGVNWAQFRQKLQRGCQHVYNEFLPLTQASTGGLFQWGCPAPLKIAYADSGVVDVVASPNAMVPVSSLGGWSAAFSTAANGPLLGFLYQNPPTGGMGQSTGSTSIIYPADTTGPLQGVSRLYGFFVVPFVSAPNLQAEAESGTLGTGWSSVTTSGESGNAAAKAASGTVAGNADLFGTSWVPGAGGPVPSYDVWFRVKVTSAAGTAAEMTLGLWDVTAAAFMAGGSTTFKANQVTTAYQWYRANTALPLTPTAGHNMQFRAVTALTLGTDWFIDEAVLAPRQSQFFQGILPADIWSEFAFDRYTEWVMG
jgi:hypothetical protein